MKKSDVSINTRHQRFNAVSALIAKVHQKGFGDAVLEYLANAARINSFGAFYISDLARPKPVLSIWSGRISDYWFRQNAKLILNDPNIQSAIIERIKAAPIDGVSIERWHPSDDDPRKPMYSRANLIERVGVCSRDGRTGFQTFFLRGARRGLLSDKEFDDLCALLPTVQGLIGLRHRLVGSENFHHTVVSSPSNLRERSVGGFADLSQREAEVCDGLVEGKTAEATAIALGIAESTVRTLRQRSYRKLGVSSATELMALIVFDARLS